MEEEIKQQVEQIMNDFLYEYMRKSVDGGHTATGNLALSGKSFVTVNGKTFHISFGFEDYFYWAEYGRKSGKFPPIDKIREWIRVKPILPRAINGKLPNENQLAYLIGRKIATKGTKGSGVYEKTKTEFDLTNKLYNAVADKFLEIVNEKLIW